MISTFANLIIESIYHNICYNNIKKHFIVILFLVHCYRLNCIFSQFISNSQLKFQPLVHQNVLVSNMADDFAIQIFLMSLNGKEREFQKKPALLTLSSWTSSLQKCKEISFVGQPPSLCYQQVNTGWYFVVICFCISNLI